MHRVCYPADASLPLAILPGSFNPLHHGHLSLAAAASRRLGQDVHFELSVANVDKPELSPEEVDRRVRQFADRHPVWVTRAPTFVEKAELFPGVTFVIGWDTAVRLIDPRYYGLDPRRRDEAARALLGRGCRFLVGGRVDAAGAFREWDGADYGGLFQAIPEVDFRADISSTVLRRQAAFTGTLSSCQPIRPTS